MIMKYLVHLKGSYDIEYNMQCVNKSYQTSYHHNWVQFTVQFFLKILQLILTEVYVRLTDYHFKTPTHLSIITQEDRDVNPHINVKLKIIL